jgi:integrase
MQANATEQTTASSNASAGGQGGTPYVINVINVKKHAPQFRRAVDGRKQPIRGLWVATASGKYYAQIKMEHPTTGRRVVRRTVLKDKDSNPVTTLAEAKNALALALARRDEGEVLARGRCPKFSEFVTTYLAWAKAGEGQKAPGTIEKERSGLKRWGVQLGDQRLDQIRPGHVNGYIQKRLNEGVSRRTAAVDVIALRNVLNHAIDEQWIKALPIPRARRNKSKRGQDTKPERQLLATEDLAALCEAALATKADGSSVTKNGQQLCDYLRFMAYSGTRRNEALGCKWSDVDFDGDLLHVRRQSTSRGIEQCKNSEERAVNFNPKLDALLRDMHQRRAQDTDWVFPSPQRGDKDIPARSFRESLELARAHALAGHPKLADKGFHDLRHFFISYAVMSGVDYMTIAKWVGHRDGGILIGKVYGKLNDKHKAAMARKLNFGPVIVEAEAAHG